MAGPARRTSERRRLAALHLASACVLAAACGGESPSARRMPADAAPISSESPSMRVTHPSERELELAQDFGVPRPRLWAALTEREQLLQWMGTPDMRLEACELDLRVNGSLRLAFRRTSGRALEVRGRYTAIDAPNSFAYVESYDFSPLVLEVETRLEERPGGSRLVQRMRYATRTERDEDEGPVVTSTHVSWARLEQHVARTER